MIKYQLVFHSEKSWGRDAVEVNVCFLFSIFYIRDCRQDVFCRKDVLRYFTKFTEKHLCQSLFFNKVAGLSPATLLKRRLWQRCFPVSFTKFLWTPFLTEHLRWLLLELVNLCYYWNHQKIIDFLMISQVNTI